MIYLEIIYIKMIILLDNLVTSPVGNENKVGLVSSILILFGSICCIAALPLGLWWHIRHALKQGTQNSHFRRVKNKTILKEIFNQ